MEPTKQSSILPARRAQWLVSALSYSYGLSQPLQNEVVVLATGLDQYLQELFHHLDFDGKENISTQHFQTLLQVLGLQRSTNQDLLQNNDTNGALDFKDFHQKLVHMFIEEKDEDGLLESKKWRCEGEFVEAEVNLVPREGHSVRTMCTECFNKKPVSEVLHSVLYKQGRIPSGEDIQNSDVIDLESTSPLEQVSRLQEENEGLRELVEDMRQALQSSDAKNLALEVALQNLRSGKSLHPANHHDDDGDMVVKPKYLKFLMSELNKLQDRRNMQLEEAILYTQELEADLWRSRKDQETLYKARKALVHNQRSVTEQLEKARHILSTGLQRVKVLENQSCKVEELQRRLQEIQSTIVGLDDRCCTRQCCSSTRYKNNNIQGRKATDNLDHFEVVGSDRTSPTGSSGSSAIEDRTSTRTGDGDQMIRGAVEGQEASDDDEDWQPICNGNDTGTVRRAKVSELQTKLDEMRRQLQQERRKKDELKNTLEQERSDNLARSERNAQEIDHLQREVQHCETERVRLSLVESTTKEIITLLRKLKMHLSRRSVGKIIMDTLELCLHDNTTDPEGDVKRFLHCFLKQLQHHNQVLQSGTTNESHQTRLMSYTDQDVPRNTRMRLAEPVARHCRSGSSRFNGSSFQVKTNFYQFGGRMNLSTFKAIKTEMGTV